MKRQIWLRIAATAALLGWMWLIFSFSAQPAAASGEISSSFSSRLVERVSGLMGVSLSAEKLARAVTTIEYPVRKAAHMTEYAVMGLLSFAFYETWGAVGRRRYWLAFGTAVLYAATDEFHQLFVPGRSGQLYDVCIDAAGALLGLLCWYFLIKIKGKHCEKKTHPLQ